MMMNKFDPQAYIKSIGKAAEYVSDRINKEKKEFQPKVVLTLGSGLSDLAKLIDTFLVIPYQDIPYFPQLTDGPYPDSCRRQAHGLHFYLYEF